MSPLFIHCSHAFGGSSKSLLELYVRLKAAGVSGTVISPKGKSSTAFKAAGMNVFSTWGLSQFDNTQYGYYRGLRWLIVLREITLFPASILALWRIRKRKFDLIHINEMTLLPIGIIAKRLLRIPLVAHVRSPQRSADSGLRSRLITGCLRRHADAIVAIDHTVASTLDGGLIVDVVHNGLHVFDTPASTNDGDRCAPLRIGFIGVFLPLKGIYELIEAARILKERNIRVEFLVAGENPRPVKGLTGFLLSRLKFAQDVQSEVERMLARYELEEHVKLVGFVDDVRNFYPRLDILCFPSHLNAAGRPVFEAAFHSVPCVVAVDHPKPDAVMHGVTGLAIPRPDPELIANAIQQLAEDPDYRRKLGRQAKSWAEEHFSMERSAGQMLEIYQRVIQRSTVGK